MKLQKLYFSVLKTVGGFAAIAGLVCFSTVFSAAQGGSGRVTPTSRGTTKTTTKKTTKNTTNDWVDGGIVPSNPGSVQASSLPIRTPSPVPVAVA